MHGGWEDGLCSYTDMDLFILNNLLVAYFGQIIEPF